MSRGFDILKEHGVNITKEEYLELEKTAGKEDC